MLKINHGYLCKLKHFLQYFLFYIWPRPQSQTLSFRKPRPKYVPYFSIFWRLKSSKREKWVFKLSFFSIELQRFTFEIYRSVKTDHSYLRRRNKVVCLFVCTGGSRLPKWGNSPFPSLPIPFAFPLLPFPSPFLSLPLEVGPLNTARDLGSAVSSQRGL